MHHPAETELLNEAAEKFRRKNTTAKHRDWYPPEVGRLPLPLARLICQRAAVWWDMSQRRKYAGLACLIVAVMVVGVSLPSHSPPTSASATWCFPFMCRLPGSRLGRGVHPARDAVSAWKSSRPN